ncbi:LOW QUALITY PROTEIN: hypothetical protein U9M48_029014 [Paspalum notatum var. saurae]|uniref:DDE Tnp4 domain-containing protein n=1 Tax=Paspalum notatum var. saurae TaxID=547442 RepID=A0AAQ3TXU7_PASNO
MDDQSLRRLLVRRGAALVVVLAAWMLVRFRMCNQARRRISYGPLAPRDEIRQHNLMFIYNSDDTEEPHSSSFAIYFALEGCLRTAYTLLLRSKWPCFYMLWVTTSALELLDYPSGGPLKLSAVSSVKFYFFVGELRNEMILPPSSITPTKILHSPRWNLFFKVSHCYGVPTYSSSPIPPIKHALLSCRTVQLMGLVLARVPASEKAAFLGRKYTTTQNVMAAVDFDLRFTYALAGWEGSAHDACILADALERDDGLRVPKYFLVDAGYAAKPEFLPLYRSTRYHLREFGARRPQNAKELFNLRHSALRVTAERTFGALKNRFKILYNKPFHPYPTQVKLVLACCILHNWILRHGVDDHVPSEDSWEGNHENDHGTDENNPENLVWVAMRDNMANQMWAARAGHNAQI